MTSPSFHSGSLSPTSRTKLSQIRFQTLPETLNDCYCTCGDGNSRAHHRHEVRRKDSSWVKESTNAIAGMLLTYVVCGMFAEKPQGRQAVSCLASYSLNIGDPRTHDTYTDAPSITRTARHPPTALHGPSRVTSRPPPPASAVAPSVAPSAAAAAARNLHH